MKHSLKTLLALLLVCLLSIGGAALAEIAADPIEPEAGEIEFDLMAPEDGENPDDGAAEDPDATFDDSVRYPIDAATFPDAFFRGFVAQYDANGDGFLSEEELYYVDNMNLIETEVADLKGIELFTNLKYLDVERTKLTRLDVSANTNLEVLYCSYSPISTLTIGEAHDAMLDIECWETKLTGLDVSGCPELKFLDVGFSSVKSLDVSANFELRYLGVFMTQIQSLDVSECEELVGLVATYCEHLTKLTLPETTKLELLNIAWTGLGEIDLTGSPKLQEAMKEKPRTYADDDTKLMFGNVSELDYGVKDRSLSGPRVEITYKDRVVADGKVLYKLEPAKVALNKSGTVTLNKGKTLQLQASVEPEEADTTLTWSSSNEKIATVSQKGKVTAKGAGVATITVKTDNGKTAKLKVKVVVKPTKVKLNKTGAQKLKKGESLQLKATLTPEGATAKLTWKTSNPKVATVSSKGKVTAKKAGTAVITVKTDNKKSAKVKIKVTE